VDLESVIRPDPEILADTPVCIGRQAPGQSIFDTLEDEELIDNVVEGFPGVKRDPAIAVFRGLGAESRAHAEGISCNFRFGRV